MLVRDIMTRDPMCVLPSDPIWRAAEMMRYHGIGCTPVVADEESRRVVGFLTDRDIATRCVVGIYLSLDRPSSATVALLLTRVVLPKAPWLTMPASAPSFVSTGTRLTRAVSIFCITREASSVVSTAWIGVDVM